jgi:hypothetical protein
MPTNWSRSVSSGQMLAMLVWDVLTHLPLAEHVQYWGNVHHQSAHQSQVSEITIYLGEMYEPTNRQERPANHFLRGIITTNNHFLGDPLHTMLILIRLG